VANGKRPIRAQKKPAGERRTDHEPSDPEWLEGLALRAKLADTTWFDRDARCWRAMQKLREMLPADLQPTEEEFGKARTLVLAVAEGRFTLAAAYVWGVPSPEHWQPCSRCGGSGKFGSVERACAVCDGGGYEIPVV
jgi:hypothetical protein